MPDEALKKFIKNTDFFQGLDEKTCDSIIKNTTSSLFSKGKILFIADEPAQYFYLVRSGYVKLFRETLDGAQAILDILSAGHLLGETAIFQDNTYPYSAEIIETSDIITLPLASLKAELEHSPALAHAFLKHMTKIREKQEKDLEHRSLQNAPQRIGCFLLRLCPLDHKDPVTLHLPYDKTLIAGRLGMQPETFSRALKRLRTETGLEIQGSTITIPCIQTLSDYTCVACSSSFPCKDPHSTDTTEPKRVCNHHQG